jgi:hypothetical protein
MDQPVVLEQRVYKDLLEKQPIQEPQEIRVRPERLVLLVPEVRLELMESLPILERPDAMDQLVLLGLRDGPETLA